MGENRLFQMVYLLLEKGSMSAPELAKRFEMSVRTIYRDIDTLSAAGIPVYTMQGKGGGIFIEENFVLNKSLLTQEEQKQILMALQGITIVTNENTLDILSKLSGAFQRKNENWIGVDFADWNRTNENVFQTLKDAIFQSKKVSFIYFNGKGESRDRIVEPLKLVFRSKEWYLYAYCCWRKEYRLFKFRRIKELSITSQGFTRSIPSQTIENIDPHKEETVSITLLFDKEIAFRIYDYHDNVMQREDGNFLVTIDLLDNEWLYSYLLSYGDKVEVIAPQSVRNEMKIRIRNLHKKYQT